MLFGNNMTLRPWNLEHCGQYFTFIVSVLNWQRRYQGDLDKTCYLQMNSARDYFYDIYKWAEFLALTQGGGVVGHLLSVNEGPLDESLCIDGWLTE